MSGGVAADLAPFGADIFGLTIESSPVGMIVSDSGGTILLINGEIERLFGYDRDELLGRPIDILLPERQRRKRRSDPTFPWALIIGECDDL